MVSLGFSGWDLSPGSTLNNGKTFHFIIPRIMTDAKYLSAILALLHSHTEHINSIKSG